METIERPLTVQERAFQAAELHPACTLEFRRLKKQRLFQVIFKSKPAFYPPFLYKAKGKTIDEAMGRATEMFIGVARKAAAVVEAKKAAEEAAAEAPETTMQEEVLKSARRAGKPERLEAQLAELREEAVSASAGD